MLVRTQVHRFGAKPLKDSHEKNNIQINAKTKTIPYDVAEQLRTKWLLILMRGLPKAPDDAAGIARALGDIAHAKAMTEVARNSGLSRERLYKALSDTANPSFATVLKVAGALGLRLHAEAA